MSEFHTVCKVHDLKEGEGKTVAIGHKLIALFLIDGKPSAIDDTCPHMGASLAAGYVENGGVMCPWHAWRFCVTTGTWLDNPKSSLRQEVFETRLVGDEIQVQIPD